MRRFYDRRDVEDAMESLYGRVLDGRELRVQMGDLKVAEQRIKKDQKDEKGDFN